jgi:hypothetical protein
MKIFLLALTVRLAVFIIFSFVYENPTHKESEASIMYETSINLEPTEEMKSKIHYTQWWERSPVYVYFLHVTNQSIELQLLLSALTVLLIYKINHVAGWIFCFYPQSVILSFQYNKETLLWFIEAVIFLIIFRRYKYED